MSHYSDKRDASRDGKVIDVDFLSAHPIAMPWKETGLTMPVAVEPVRWTGEVDKYNRKVEHVDDALDHITPYISKYPTPNINSIGRYFSNK